jgi:hypothetical protein
MLGFFSFQFARQQRFDVVRGADGESDYLTKGQIQPYGTIPSRTTSISSAPFALLCEAFTRRRLPTVDYSIGRHSSEPLDVSAGCREPLSEGAPKLMGEMGRIEKPRFVRCGRDGLSFTDAAASEAQSAPCPIAPERHADLAREQALEARRG